MVNIHHLCARVPLRVTFFYLCVLMYHILVALFEVYFLVRPYIFPEDHPKFTLILDPCKDHCAVPEMRPSKDSYA